MSTLVSDEHTWFRHRLADHLLDLLDDAETERLRAHASGCAACGGLLAAATREGANGWLGADHPTPAMLHRWRAEPETFDATTAGIVREHVASCESCATDLAELGGDHAPRPRLEAPPEPAATRLAGTHLARHLWTGAAGGALATAAAFLLFWPRPEPAAPIPVPRATAPREAPTPGQRPVLLPATRPVRIAAPTRGGETVTRIALVEPRGIVKLLLPTLFLPEETALDVALVDRRGEVVSGTRAIVRDAQRDGVLLDTRGLAAEAFTLRVRWHRDGRPDERRYPILFQQE